MVGVVYLKTSDPGRLVCVWVWDDGWFDEPDALLIDGEVDENSAVANFVYYRASLSAPGRRRRRTASSFVSLTECS